jgi:hypothetical protein
VRYTVERGATEHELDIFNFKTLDQNLMKLEELLTPVLDLWREFEALAEWKAPLKSGVTVAVCLYIFWNDALWLLLPGSVVLVAIRTGWAGLKKYSASSTGRDKTHKSALPRTGTPLAAHPHDRSDNSSIDLHHKATDREPRDRDALPLGGEGGGGGAREGEKGVSSSAAPHASVASGASLTRRALAMGTSEADGRRNGDGVVDKSVRALNGHGRGGLAQLRAEELAGASSQGGDAQSVGRTWHGDGKGLGEEAGAVMRKEDAGKSIGTPGSWFKSIGDKVVYARELKKNLRKLVADNIVEVLCLSVCLSVCLCTYLCVRALSLSCSLCFWPLALRA